MKDIDEAIAHCLEVAKEQEEEAKADNEYSDACLAFAAKHRQLAEWLKDYKRLLEREPCEDAISRESVLTLFATHDGKYLYEAIQELPPVLSEPKSDWFPVSKKLPETNDDVLVYDGVDMFVAWRWITCRNQEWDSSDGDFDRDTPIIAWMPLPEPYKAESEE